MTDIPYLGASRLRDLLARHGVRPRKELGQNFVIDPNTIRKVVAVADVRPGDRVVDIGAGCGSLTLGLAAAGARVVAIEFDERLIPILHEVTGALENVEVVQGDATTLDLRDLGAGMIVANLPYNIATHLVVEVLETAPDIAELTVMVQKEVGERLAAGPGTKAYGQLSVVVDHFARASVAARVSRRAFYPEPSVDSVVVRIARKPSREDVDQALLFATVRAAFAQRRKILRNTLAEVAGSPELAERALQGAGIPVDARAEEIEPAGFAAIAKALDALVR